jgi:hypothetical protein
MPKYVARSPKVAARMVGDEMMVMSGKDTTLFALNGTAAILWQAADGKTPLSEIVEQHICSEFEVEPDVALRDAEELVEELAGDGILLVSDAPIDGSVEAVKR